MNAASVVLAKYDAFNNYPMTRKGVSLRTPTCRGVAISALK